MHFFVLFRAFGGSCDLIGFPIVWNACGNAGVALGRSETVVGRRNDNDEQRFGPPAPRPFAFR